MLVEARTASFSDAPEEVIASGWTRECIPGITRGHDYIVHAISVFRQPIDETSRLVYFQIVDDTKTIAWLPSFLFHVVDRKIPDGWECNLLGPDHLVIGPSFITESAECYRAMVELEPEAVKIFWRYIGENVEYPP